MPTEAFLYYRNNFLVPFMQSQGIAEGTMKIGKVMAWTDWPAGNDVATAAKNVLQLGASGYLQYAPGDGLGYFEPNPQTLPWYNTLKGASTVQGLDLLGVLIDSPGIVKGSVASVMVWALWYGVIRVWESRAAKKTVVGLGIGTLE